MKGYYQNIIKRALFAGFFVVIGISCLQLKFNFVTLAPLEGYAEFVSRPYFSTEAWFDGKFQQQTERYADENIGFRPVFVRLRNQLMFSLFRETTVQEIVIGKEDFLYERNYILAWLGRDFLGKDSIDKQVEKLKLIQDTLAGQDIHLAVVLAAGKASFFPQYIPDIYRPGEKSISNYEYYRTSLAREGVHYIDFNDWFLQIKDTSTYPLYPKYGIHWSRYAEALVADSILHYIELQKDIRIPDLVYDTIELSDTAREPDYDMAGAMNLLYKLPGYPLAYPKIMTKYDSGDVKPAVTVIGDSYYSSLYSTLLAGNVFDPSQFWFYNKHINSTAFQEMRTIGQIDPVEEIKKQDVVFILSTEANLGRLGFGAIDMIYDAFYRPEFYHENFLKRKERIDYWKNRIRNNEEWIRSIREKSIERQIPLEEMLQMDAEYMVNQEGL